MTVKSNHHKIGFEDGLADRFKLPNMVLEITKEPFVGYSREAFFTSSWEKPRQVQAVFGGNML